MVRVFNGEIFLDNRGEIKSINNFNLEEIKRIYFITHPDVSTIRGWHGHKLERKWFYCIKGSFVLGLVIPDNWDDPSPNLPSELYKLDDSESKVICVPSGYANCLKAVKKNSIMLVMSDKTLSEAEQDSWRYNSDLWVDWKVYR